MARTVAPLINKCALQLEASGVDHKFNLTKTNLAERKNGKNYRH